MHWDIDRGVCLLKKNYNSGYKLKNRRLNRSHTVFCWGSDFATFSLKKSKCRIQNCHIFVLLSPLKQCINLKWPLNILNHVSHSHLFMSSHIEHYYIPNCKRPITSHHSYHLTVQYPKVCVQLTSHVRSTIKAVDWKKHPNEVMVHFVWAFEQNTSP